MEDMSSNASSPTSLIGAAGGKQAIENFEPVLSPRERVNLLQGVH